MARERLTDAQKPPRVDDRLNERQKPPPPDRLTDEQKPRRLIRMRTYVTKGRIPTRDDRFRGVTGVSARDNRVQAEAEVNATIPVFDREAGLAELASYYARAGRG